MKTKEAIRKRLRKAVFSTTKPASGLRRYVQKQLEKQGATDK